MKFYRLRYINNSESEGFQGSVTLGYFSSETKIKDTIERCKKQLKYQLYPNVFITEECVVSEDINGSIYEASVIFCDREWEIEYYFREIGIFAFESEAKYAVECFKSDNAELILSSELSADISISKYEIDTVYDFYVE